MQNVVDRVREGEAGQLDTTRFKYHMRLLGVKENVKKVHFQPPKYLAGAELNISAYELRY